MSIAAGDALTLELDRGFVIASGIECSAPVIAGGVRQDELLKTGHDESVEEDLALVAEFGIRYLRYGIPFHIVAADPRRLDWALDGPGHVGAAGQRDRADRRPAPLRPARRPLGLRRPGAASPLRVLRGRASPIAIRGSATTRRSTNPWSAPASRPSSAGGTSAARTMPSFVAAIDGAATCAVLAMAAIRARRPDAVFVQSDTCEGLRACGPGGPASRRSSSTSCGSWPGT